MISRRHALAGGVAAAMGGCASGPGPAVLEDFAALERRASGRLGVAVLDTRDGAMVGWRTGERFGMCSTFKLPLAAVVLREIDAGRLARDQIVPYGAGDMVFHAPVTGPGWKRAGSASSHWRKPSRSPATTWRPTSCCAFLADRLYSPPTCARSAIPSPASTGWSPP